MRITVIKIVLAAIILLLCGLIYRSISMPVRFESQLSSRGEVIISKLKDIRTAEILFRSHYGHYTSSFDSLKNFVKTGFIPVLKIVPDPRDTTFTHTIADTIGNVKIFDSIFVHKNYTVEQLDEIPFSNGEKFTLMAGSVNKAGVNVSVFEAAAPLQTYTAKLNRQMVINKIKELEDKNKYAGLKVGSMTDASTDGNWE